MVSFEVFQTLVLYNITTLYMYFLTLVDCHSCNENEMKFQLIRSTHLHYRTHCIYKTHVVCQTRHKTRFLSTHQNATPEKWREFHSHLKSLINTLPPYPFKAPPTYSPKIDTLLDQITPFLQHMTFQRDERQLLISADGVNNRRLLKLASFQMHRHRRALDLRNLYLGIERESPLKDQSKVKPFTTYTREYNTYSIELKLLIIEQLPYHGVCDYIII